MGLFKQNHKSLFFGFVTFVAMSLLSTSQGELKAQSQGGLFPETRRLATDVVPAVCASASNKDLTKCQAHQQKAQELMNEVLQEMGNTAETAGAFKNALSQSAPFLKQIAGNVIRGEDAADGMSGQGAAQIAIAVLKGGGLAKNALQVQSKLNQVKLELVMASRYTGQQAPSVLEARKEWVDVARNAQSSVASLRRGEMVPSELIPTMGSGFTGSSVASPNPAVASSDSSSPTTRTPSSCAGVNGACYTARVCPAGQRPNANGSCVSAQARQSGFSSASGKTSLWNNAKPSVSLREASKLSR
jgi:hypothetical protein